MGVGNVLCGPRERELSASYGKGQPGHVARLALFCTACAAEFHLLRHVPVQGVLVRPSLRQSRDRVLVRRVRIPIACRQRAADAPGDVANGVVLVGLATLPAANAVGRGLAKACAVVKMQNGPARVAGPGR